MTAHLDDLEGLHGLADPVRRSLYRYVVAQGAPVGRDAAARGVGISRSLAAYHLDRLVDVGLLETRYERLTARRGPGAGRPSKLYVRSTSQFQVSVPPRDYEIAARLLAAAVESGGSGAAVANVARTFGADVGAAVASRCGEAASAGDVTRCLVEELRARGYEPYDADDGTIRLRNCPFDALAAAHRELVCGMNLAVMEGATEALGARAPRPRLAPRPGECCVAFERAPGRD